MNAGATCRDLRLFRNIKAKMNDEQLEAAIKDLQYESYGRQAKHDKMLSQFFDAQEMIAAQKEAMQ